MTGRAVRLLDLGEVSPLRSQALYHGLGESMDEQSPDTVVLCRPAATCFSVGHHHSPGEELDLEWCRREGHPVYRRRIGGGTVLLDRDQLFYQCIFHRRRAPLMVEGIYRRFLMPAVDALRGLGVPATLEGINEIEAAGRRMAGTGGGQIGEAVVVVGNVLFEFPAQVMARAWRAPSPEFRRLAEEGLRRRIGTLGGMRPAPPSEAVVRRHLIACYEAALGRPLVPGGLTSAEDAAVRAEEARLARLAEPPAHVAPRLTRLKITRRVRVQEWTWPADGGEARVTARVADGRVEDVVVAGAPLAGADVERRVLEALTAG